MNEVFEVSQSALIEGPAEVKILEGKASIFQAMVGKGYRFHVSPGRVMPILNEDEKVKLSLKGKGNYRVLSSALIPSDWYDAAKELANYPKKQPKALILGRMNTGKSSLALFLINYLLKRDKKVGLIDADVGQSKVGPPGVLGAAKISQQITTLYNTDVSKGYFIGDKSPGGHLLQMITGVKQLSEHLEDDNTVSEIVIDTTGMVFGGPARALKRHKIEILSPDMIFVLERHREMEHLIRENPDQRVSRLSVPEEIQPLSRSKRIKLRNKKLKKFSRTSCFEVSLSLNDSRIQQSILRNGYRIPPSLDLPKEVKWAEISAEGLLLLCEEDLKEYQKTTIIERIKNLLQTLKGVKSLKNSNLLKINKKKSEFLQIVREINPQKLRISLLPHTFYDNIYVGLRRKSDLYAVGRIERINFEDAAIHVRGHLLKERKGDLPPLPVTLVLGFLRFTKEWEEIGKRSVGSG